MKGIAAFNVQRLTRDMAQWPMSNGKEWFNVQRSTFNVEITKTFSRPLILPKAGFAQAREERQDRQKIKYNFSVLSAWRALRSLRETSFRALMPQGLLKHSDAWTQRRSKGEGEIILLKNSQPGTSRPAHE